MDEHRMEILSWGPVNDPPHPSWTVQSVTPVESTVDELVAFLRGCLDEDERVARATAALSWSAEDHEGRGAIRDSNGFCVIHDDGELGLADAIHIALHDPARVLREVQSKRAILDALPSDEGYDSGRAKFADYESCDDSCIGQVMHEVVKLLALPYSDRPGYREEWKP